MIFFGLWVIEIYWRIWFMIKNHAPTLSTRAIELANQRRGRRSSSTLKEFSFRSITIVFHNNFPPAVHHIFWAERQPKRILASIRARENIHHSKTFFKVKQLKFVIIFYTFEKQKTLTLVRQRDLILG
jgi:hypothetical protein